MCKRVSKNSFLIATSVAKVQAHEVCLKNFSPLKSLLIIMAKKQPKNNEYRLKNEAFIQALRDGEEELLEISQGVLVKILKSGDGDRCPRAGNVVTVNYKGSFINGRVFDSSYERGYPEAFRLSDLIVGWQIALTQMKVGDHWIVYIPWEVGYGSRANGPIPAYSTLILEMELVAIM